MTEPAKPSNSQPQASPPVPSEEERTAAHDALLEVMAKEMVERYLAEKDRP